MGSNKYQKSLIYTIRSYSNENLIYVGSTCNSLTRRLSQHKSNFKRYYNNGIGNYVTSFEIVKFPDCYIELLENFPCNNKTELNAREGFHIRKMNCVNKQVAGRSNKEYYENNKDKVLEKQKEYRENNKEVVSQQKKTKHICECGGNFTTVNKGRHEKTNIHQNYLNNLPILASVTSVTSFTCA